MADPFIGQIQCFGFNFAPSGWAKCDGQTLSIAQNTALFSLLGTTYGGNGQTDFRLPDFRGRVALHAGNGPGLTPRNLGSAGGSETTTLTTSNLPPHDHVANLRANAGTPNSFKPEGNHLAAAMTYRTGGADVNLGAGSVTSTSTGNGASFNTMPPFLSLNWCIALFGIFPSQ
ncbi:MAG: tail fiber protein [Planctomycetota bacterium]